MLRQSIIQKMSGSHEEEIEFTEEELVYITSEWFKQHFKVDVKVTTRGYTEDIYMKHGLRIQIKK